MLAVPLQTSCIMTVLQKRAAQQKKKSRCWVQIREADTYWLLQPIKAQLRRQTSQLGKSDVDSRCPAYPAPHLFWRLLLLISSFPKELVLTTAICSRASLSFRGTRVRSILGTRFRGRPPEPCRARGLSISIRVVRPAGRQW